MCLGMSLPQSVHSAEESAEVGCQPNNGYGHGLDWQSVSWQDCSLIALRSPVDEPHYPEQQARYAAEHQVHQQDALRG